MKKLFKTLLLLISSAAFVALCIAGYCACKYYQLPLLPDYTDYESLEERATEAQRIAQRRGLMIHSARWVDINCWRTYIPLNTRCCMGCVTISSRGMSFISQIMKSENKEVLLWSWE